MPVNVVVGNFFRANLPACVSLATVFDTELTTYPEEAAICVGSGSAATFTSSSALTFSAASDLSLSAPCALSEYG